MSRSNDHDTLVVTGKEGDLLWVVGDRYRMLATSEQTGGRFAIWEAHIHPGGGPPPHRHLRESESFFVIDGEVAFGVGEDRITAGPGTFISIPEGTPHWFRNETDRLARVLMLVTPGGFEGLFREAGAPASDPHATPPPVGPDEIARIKAAAARYGLELLID